MGVKTICYRNSTLVSTVDTGKSLTDRRSLLVYPTPVILQKLTTVFDNQIVISVQQELEPDRSESLQGDILLHGELHARKPSAAGCITAAAVVTAVYGFIQQYTMLLYPLHSEQIQGEPPHAVNQSLKILRVFPSRLISPGPNVLITPNLPS